MQFHIILYASESDLSILLYPDEFFLDQDPQPIGTVNKIKDKPVCFWKDRGFLFYKYMCTRVEWFTTFFAIVENGHISAHQAQN